MKIWTLFLSVLLCLSILQPVFATEEYRCLVSLTNAVDIGVIDYEIDRNRKIQELRRAVFPALGTVGNTDITLRGSIVDVKYTYVIDGNNPAQLAQAQLDLDDFEVLSHKNLKPQYVGFDIGSHSLSSNANKIRFTHAGTNDNLATSSTKKNGKVSLKAAGTFNFNDGGRFVSGDVNWGGTWGGQFRFHDDTQSMTAEFTHLNGKGKATGQPVGFDLSGIVGNLRLSDEFQGTYRAGFTEFKGDKAAVFTVPFDSSTNFPTGDPVKFTGFKKTDFRNALFFGGMELLSFDNEIYILYGQDRSGKLTMRGGFQDALTGKRIGKTVELIGPGDPLLTDSPFVHGFSMFCAPS